MADDLAVHAVVEETLEQLDPNEDDKTLAYEDLLRRLQTVLQEKVAQTEEPTPEEEQAVSQALSRLHPTADDAQADHGTRLRRLQVRVDVELSRWTSAMVQPPGPSGATAVAATPPPPVE